MPRSKSEPQPLREGGKTKHMKILYVEDNPANVYLVKRVARAGKHSIVSYAEGAKVLQKFEKVQPDLVLMDIQLVGDVGGLDVVRELRRRGVTVPIVAVTAYAMLGDRERSLEAGCDEYLAKPLSIPDLMTLFQKYATRLAEQQTQQSDPAAENASSESGAANTVGETPSEATAEPPPDASSASATPESNGSSSTSAAEEDASDAVPGDEANEH